MYCKLHHTFFRQSHSNSQNEHSIPLVDLLPKSLKLGANQSHNTLSALALQRSPEKGAWHEEICLLIMQCVLDLLGIGHDWNTQGMTLGYLPSMAIGWACICVGAHMCRCMNTCMCVCECHSLGAIYAVFWAEAHWVGKVGWPTSPRYPPASVSSVLGLQVHIITSGFLHGFWYGTQVLMFVWQALH